MQFFCFGLYTGTLVLFNMVTITVADQSKKRYTADDSDALQKQQKESPMSFDVLSAQLAKVNGTLKYTRTPDLVVDYGYPFEIHNVVTKSGYIIELHRIPGGKLDNISSSDENDTSSTTPEPTEIKKIRRPVLLHHGLWQSSFHFVASNPEHSLAFLLADEGYDVWLANARGNCYSNRHTTMTKSDKKYWNFNLDDMGGEDLTETIDFVLKETEQENLYYIGFSFGSQIFFVGSSLHPEQNSKVKLMIAMSPMAYMSNTKSPIMNLSHLQITTLFYEMIQATFGYSPVPDPKLTEYVKTYVRIFCNKDPQSSPSGSHCASGLFGNNVNPSGIYPASPNSNSRGTRVDACSISSKLVIQLSQIINSNQFGRYDYRFKNSETYGQLTPPLYKLWRVSVPVALIWAKNDIYNDPSDVEKLVRHLPNIVENHRVQSESFSHTDFLFGSEAKELVYRKILEYLRKYS